MTDDDEWHRQMTGWILSHRLEAAAKYAQAGRSLRNLTEDHLFEKWIEALNAWGESPDDRPAMIDAIDGELALRGKDQFPVSAAPRAWEKINAAIRSRYDEIRKAPPLRNDWTK